MNYISEKQINLLRKFLELRDNPLNNVYDFYSFLQKSVGEPLHPRWPSAWERYKNVFKNAIEEKVYPPKIIDYIEKIIDQERNKHSIKDIQVNSDSKVTFLLGAGSSAPSGIPTVKDLLPKLWERAKKIDIKDLDKLSKWCNNRKITNIEDLLTSAYIANLTAKNRSLISLFHYFLFSDEKADDELEEIVRTKEIDVSSISFLQDTLQTLFGLLTSTMISAKPNKAHWAIVDFIKDHKNTSIITTNYDGCMDEAILQNNLHIKGIIGNESKKNNFDTIPLIKMHGSINWAYCDSCQDSKEFNLLDLKKMYNEDTFSFPVLGICKRCGGLRRPLLVPPLSFKFLIFPNLIDIWNSAKKSIEEADYLIVIGYSFSEADTYITKIVSKSMSMKKSQKIIVIDTNEDLLLELRERFSNRIDNFEEERILGVVGDCEKKLPEFLKSMLGKDKVKKESESPKKK